MSDSKKQPAKLAEFVCPAMLPWSIPVYDRLFQLMEKRLDVFRPYATIYAVFGCFPNFKWNGGCGGIFGTMPTEGIVRRTFEFFAEHGVDVFLTASNCSIEERDLYDSYANRIMQIAEEQNKNVKVLVASPILEQYLRETYPHLDLIKSIIAAENISDYDVELRKYSQVVFSRKFAFDVEKIKQVSEENRHKCEILVNEECDLYCPHQYTHYKAYGPVFLFANEADEMPGFQCIAETTSMFGLDLQRYHTINSQELEEVYMPLGYSKFKISGRSSNGRIIREIVPFFIKPEFQTEIYYDIRTYITNHPVSFNVKNNQS